jgi:hypothetical protein
MENVGKFYSYLENITVIWYILWPFDKLVAIWHIFPVWAHICMYEKSRKPATE